MAKAPPTKSIDDFAAWLQAALPDDVWSYFDVERSFHRDQGRVTTSVKFHLHLHRGAGNFKDGVDTRTHDLAILGRWVTHVAIPTLFPPPPKPQPPQPRRLGDHGRQIAHKPLRAITHDPPEELLFG